MNQRCNALTQKGEQCKNRTSSKDGLCSAHEEKLRYCSFCRKSNKEKSQLIAGPDVNICETCIGLTVGILLDDKGGLGKDLLQIYESQIRTELNLEEIEAIVREIEFPPEYRHAGVTILSSFSNYIRDKYQDKEVKVSIQHSDNMVRLIIETEDGYKEQIEEDLLTYGMVLSGVQPMETLTENPFVLADLKQQLRIASIQLENQKDLLSLEKRHNSQIMNKQEVIANAYENLNTLLSTSLANTSSDGDFYKSLILAYSESQSQITRSSLKVIIDQASQNGARSEQIVEDAMQEIKSQDPTLFSSLGKIAESCVGGIAGNTMYSWLVGIVASLPK